MNLATSFNVYSAKFFFFLNDVEWLFIVLNPNFLDWFFKSRLVPALELLTENDDFESMFKLF